MSDYTHKDIIKCLKKIDLKYGDTIYQQMRKLGTSYDWSRARFTLDDDYVNSVLEAFQTFHKNGWIYRGKRMINWCPECRTVISDLETEERDVAGNLWNICYFTYHV